MTHRESNFTTAVYMKQKCRGFCTTYENVRRPILIKYLFSGGSNYMIGNKVCILKFCFESIRSCSRRSFCQPTDSLIIFLNFLDLIWYVPVEVVTSLISVQCSKTYLIILAYFQLILLPAEFNVRLWSFQIMYHLMISFRFTYFMLLRPRCPVCFFSLLERLLCWSYCIL